MISQITAQFDNRDMADLALMRLRRNGVSFSSVSLTSEAHHGEASHTSSSLNMFSPFSSNMTNAPGSNDMFFPSIGSRAIFSRTDDSSSKATLRLTVNSNQIGRAREIMRSAQGHDIRVRTRST